MEFLVGSLFFQCRQFQKVLEGKSLQEYPILLNWNEVFMFLSAVWLPRPTLGHYEEAASPPNVSYWPFLFLSYSFILLKVTGNVIIKLGPKAWLRESVGFVQPFNPGLTCYLTLLLSLTFFVLLRLTLGVMIHSMKFPFSEVALYLYHSTIQSGM